MSQSKFLFYNKMETVHSHVPICIVCVKWKNEIFFSQNLSLPSTLFELKFNCAMPFTLQQYSMDGNKQRFQIQCNGKICSPVIVSASVFPLKFICNDSVAVAQLKRKFHETFNDQVRQWTLCPFVVDKTKTIANRIVEWWRAYFIWMCKSEFK